MARRPPPNPYRDLRFGALANAISERAADLLDGRQVGRRDVAYLLISAAAALRHRRAHDFEPFSRAARGEGNTADEFAALLGEEQRALRWWVYCQARDALGVPAPVAGGSPVAEAVVGSDEACIAAIRELPVPKRGE